MKRVMLVEDEEFILQGIRCIIDWEALGLEVVSMAHNGREALEAFQKDPVDIVVTDVEMPFLNGLELLGKIRKENTRARFLILSGYDEFEYARTAMKLDVEEYILKPVNEEQLKQALLQASRRLEEIDRANAGSMETKISWQKYLKGSLGVEEEEVFYQMLPVIEDSVCIHVAIMKINTDTLGHDCSMEDILIEIQKLKEKMKAIYLDTDTIFLLLYAEKEKTQEEILEYYSSFQDTLESQYGILSFVTVSAPISDYASLPGSYQNAVKLQKYRMLEGYGACIHETRIKNRKFQDADMDEALFRKMIIKKDQQGALNYIEDLFISNLKTESNIEVLYQITLKMAMILQEIKTEYKLEEGEKLRDLSEMIEKIYQAEDILGLKAVFTSEVIEMIAALHTENSQYTPVVRQIMADVQKNYKEDMNLKTLSYKYHMNASYLGQIFQKEAGCSFAQYLSNMKNKIAKDLILNTNMKINDIAKEVGYPDTSYFYRKFKQCYGVSPASLRNMKKY